MLAVKFQMLAQIVDVVVDLIKKEAFQEFFRDHICIFKKILIKRKIQNIKQPLQEHGGGKEKEKQL